MYRSSQLSVGYSRLRYHLFTESFRAFFYARNIKGHNGATQASPGFDCWERNQWTQKSSSILHMKQFLVATGLRFADRTIEWCSLPSKRLDRTMTDQYSLWRRVPNKRPLSSLQHYWRWSRDTNTRTVFQDWHSESGLWWGQSEDSLNSTYPKTVLRFRSKSSGHTRFAPICWLGCDSLGKSYRSHRQCISKWSARSYSGTREFQHFHF